MDEQRYKIYHLGKMKDGYAVLEKQSLYSVQTMGILGWNESTFKRLRWDGLDRFWYSCKGNKGRITTKEKAERYIYEAVKHQKERYAYFIVPGETEILR